MTVGKIVRVWRRLSVRAGVFAIGAVSAVSLAPSLATYLPARVDTWVGGHGLDQILDILSSNMLTVVTFSLSTLVATVSLIVSSAPPRATALMVRDSRAHRALATFLGAFVFSTAAVFALSGDGYPARARFVLLVMTLATLVAVLWTIVRWLEQLSVMGQLNNVIAQVEAVAEEALREQSFVYGETRLVPRAGGVDITAGTAGFVQRIAYKALDARAERHGGTIEILVTPGVFVHATTVVARVHHVPEEHARRDELRAQFEIGDRRTFGGDLRFGFVVLSEIGSRALSPGINDPGTAIQVLASLFRLVASLPPTPVEPPFEHLRLKTIGIREIFDDAFRPIARDGAAMMEVQVFLQKGLAQFSREPRFRAAAEALSRESVLRARASLHHPEDEARVVRAAVPEVRPPVPS